MQASSSRFKSLAVTSGFSFWFLIITLSMGLFSIEYFAIFVGIVFTITQIFVKKISKGLNIFAIINTKIFLSILFVFVITIYSVLFKLLRIDLLRLKQQNNTYWIKIESNDVRKMF